MAENILEGIQFQTTKAVFPTWKQTVSEPWTDWLDTDAHITKFRGPLKLRMKPTFEYVVSRRKGLDVTVDTFSSKEEMSRHISKHIDDNIDINIRRAETTTKSDIASRKLQYRVTNVTDSAWKNLTTVNSTVTYQGAIEFRIRPDHYYQVITNHNVIGGIVEFHDIDDLDRYISGRIRTGGLDFSVRKVKYV